MLTTILGWIASILGSPFLNKISDYLIARSNTELGKYQGDVTVATAAIQAEIASRNAQKEIIITEQGHWLTRSIRPLMALPLAIYLWKVIVWDKIICAFFVACPAGSTDPIGGNVGEWMGIIIISYFGTTAAVDVAGKILGALRRR